MPTTITYSFGDIVLVPFPFTNQASTKQRPAAIISTAAYNAIKLDVVIMAVTSQLKPAQGKGEFQIKNWQQAGLLKPSVVKPVITTIEKRLVIKKLGQLQQTDQQLLQQTIKFIFG
jgi:mRNA interferase MazF